MSQASRSDTSYMALLDAAIARRSPKRILEWGPGRSTQRMLDLLPTAEITSIEHDRRWYDHWRTRLDLRRVDLLHHELDNFYTHPPGVEGPFDLIFIDGRLRRRCLKKAAELVGQFGAVVILHDAQRPYYHAPFDLFEQVEWEGGDTVALSYRRGDLGTIGAQARDAIHPRTPHLVMVTHGARERYLRQTIPAVLQTRHPHTLTVVANDPGARALKYLEEMRPHLYGLIINSRNVGKPLAANAGWRLRDANHTVLLDDDALPLDDNWLDELVAIARQAPEAGIVGHSLEPHDHRRLRIGNLRVQLQPANLGGACILVPRRTRELCGRYDEALPPYGESDGLYGWKVRQAGLLCLYHDHTATGRRFEHLEDGEGGTQYREWKNRQRDQAQRIAAALRQAYQNGRPLNDYRSKILTGGTNGTQ